MTLHRTLTPLVVVPALAIVGARAHGDGPGPRFTFDPSATIVAAQDAVITDRPVRRGRVYGEAGQTRWTVSALWGADIQTIDSADHVILAGGGITHFITDGLSLGLEVNGAHVTQEGGKAADGINGNMTFRWHFHRERNWSAFLDGGCGLLYTERAIPTGSAHLNFTPYLGAGMSIGLGDDVRLLAGLRWLHISNANTEAYNPGRDHIAAWFGVSVGF